MSSYPTGHGPNHASVVPVSTPLYYVIFSFYIHTYILLYKLYINNTDNINKKIKKKLKLKY